jgi:hypothetical protein
MAGEAASKLMRPPKMARKPMQPSQDSSEAEAQPAEGGP